MSESTQTNITFDESLFKLEQEKIITQNEAIRLADSHNNMALRFRLLPKEKSTEAAPLIEKVHFNQHASFEQYGSFKITQLRSSEGGQSGALAMVAEALTYVFKHKGLRLDNENPAIEVQFSLSIKADENLALQPMENGHTPKSELADVGRHAKLMINIIDCKTQKAVWRLTAARDSDGPRPIQQEINRGFMDLLSIYPPAR